MKVSEVVTKRWAVTWYDPNHTMPEAAWPKPGRRPLRELAQNRFR